MLLNLSHRFSVASRILSLSRWGKLRTMAIIFCAPSLGFSVDLLGFSVDSVDINCCFSPENL